MYTRSTTRIAALAALGIAFQGATAQDAASIERYVWRQTRDAGAAVVQNAGGGEWAYVHGDPADGRRASRFVVGPTSRTEFSLFSAEEEAALWKLRQSLLTPPPKPSAHQAPRKAVHRDPIHWPRVVLRGDETCVPRLAFSDADDWQQHLVCWSRRVERVD